MATNAVMLAEACLGLEQRLWQAVIVTTIQEWISGPLRSKRKAEEYLFQDQKDFPVVCQSAGWMHIAYAPSSTACVFRNTHSS
jgi:hypothetical protein